MKKNLFLIAAFSGFVFSQAQVATAFVKGNTKVKVKQNTLFYVGGDVKVGNYTNNDKVSNEGNIRVTGNFINQNTASDGRNGKNFVNEYVKGSQGSQSHYGQLIIDNSIDDKVRGRIQGDLQLATTFAYHPISLPFSEYTVKDLVRDAFDLANATFPGSTSNNGSYDKNRFKNPVFLWNNTDFTFDHLAEGYVLEAGKYYAVNTQFQSELNAKRDGVTNYYGTPMAKDISFQVSGYEVPNKMDKNKWGELYGTYISDFTLAMPEGWNTNFRESNNVVNDKNFGNNIFWFGNPYTSNISLAKSSFVEGIIAISQPTQNEYDFKSRKGEARGTNGNLGYTADGTGDASAIAVRPYHTFVVKANLAKGQTKTFTFKQDMKTFEFSSATAPNMVLKRGDNTPVVYQAGMDIYDAEGNDTNSRFYVVAGDIYEAENKGKGIELNNINFDDALLGAYTLQEKEDGSVAENLAQNRVYINGVNFDYVGKPIQVVFNAPEAGKFSFKTRLNETLENSKYNFYFEDKKEGVVKKVTPDFEYSFTANGKETDRFVMYWMQTPSQLAPKEIEEVRTPQTIVFKDFDTHKVRFDSDWKSADVYVYSINGQLLYADKKVNTQNDYTLKLGNSTGVYVVKAVADNGEEVTKKIIK